MLFGKKYLAVPVSSLGVPVALLTSAILFKLELECGVCVKSCMVMCLSGGGIFHTNFRWRSISGSFFCVNNHSHQSLHALYYMWKICRDKQ